MSAPRKGGRVRKTKKKLKKNTKKHAYTKWYEREKRTVKRCYRSYASAAQPKGGGAQKRKKYSLSKQDKKGMTK